MGIIPRMPQIDRKLKKIPYVIDSNSLLAQRIGSPDQFALLAERHGDCKGDQEAFEKKGGL
jgi:hypothetical protein